MTRNAADKVNILLVDDQPAKLLSYELILNELDENLVKASSGQEALEILIKKDVAVILIDVCMPELDGFELAKMIREHPRFKDTAIIFVSAINIGELDSLKGYELGGVDYVPVPVVAGVLQAKVRVFADLFRKTRALARLNDELERRVEERTRELQDAISHQEMLAREVDHRARNALSVIQSIVSLTPPNDSKRFAAAITGRIHAMARAHNLLSESRWRGADLLTLVNEELEPFAQDGRVAIDGESVAIAPSVAQNLALALHEMATNAAKYGALSKQGGKLDVGWRLFDDHLKFRWVEKCPFDVGEPSEGGFGARVIDASVKIQLGGKIERDWTTKGLDCSITVPSKHFAQSSAWKPAGSSESRKPESDPHGLSGARILVVDDEPLIAQMMSRLVGDLGGFVIGPYSTLADARQAIGTRIDTALLDVNMNGEMAYGLADELVAAGTPIVFVTGYQASTIPKRFAGAPVLTKPVDVSALGQVLARATEAKARLVSCA